MSTKLQLQKEINELKKNEFLLQEVIKKFIDDFVQIKNPPKGKVRGRIIVFTKPVKAKKNLTMEFELAIFLDGLTCDKRLTLTPRIAKTKLKKRYTRI